LFRVGDPQPNENARYALLIQRKVLVREGIGCAKRQHVAFLHHFGQPRLDEMHQLGVIASGWVVEGVRQVIRPADLVRHGGQGDADGVLNVGTQGRVGDAHQS